MAKTKELTQKQFDFLHELITQKDMSSLPEKQRTFLSDPSNIQRLNKDQASNAISALVKCPKLKSDTIPVGRSNQDAPENPASTIPAGRYFIIDPMDNVEKFFKVDKPEPPSRWAGYTFVKVQASDDFYPIRNKEHREAILAEIAKDPVNAMNLYGIKLGVCGRCGRTLTHIDSRLRGLGPVCAGLIRQEFGIGLDVDSISDLLNGDLTEDE